MEEDGAGTRRVGTKGRHEGRPGEIKGVHHMSIAFTPRSVVAAVAAAGLLFGGTVATANAAGTHHAKRCPAGSHAVRKHGKRSCVKRTPAGPTALQPLQSMAPPA